MINDSPFCFSLSLTHSLPPPPTPLPSETPQTSSAILLPTSPKDSQAGSIHQQELPAPSPPLRPGLRFRGFLNIWGLSQRLEAAPSISGFLITPFPVPAVMQFRKGGGKRMFLRCFYMFSPHVPLQSHSSGFVCVCPVVFLPPGWDEQSSYQAAAL